MSNQQSGDRDSLLGGPRGRTGGPGSTTGSIGGSVASNGPESSPIYYDAPQSPQSRMLQLAFMFIVVSLVLISLVLSIYRSASRGQGIYVLLGLSLLGLLALQVIMILLIRYGDLPADKSWFLYVVGAAIALECIFTNVLLFAHG